MSRFSSRFMLWVFLALAVWTALLVPVAAQEATPEPEYRTLVPVGTVMAWAGNSTPLGWLIADGSCIATADYALLYEAIGTQYGTCGAGLFKLPDIAGRTIVGAGAGAGLSVRSPGQKFGEETHLLTLAEMPIHDHGISVSNATGAGASWQSYYTTPRVHQNTARTLSEGGQLPHNIIQPSAVLNYLIWTGIIPLNIGNPNPGPEETPMPEGTPAPEITIYSTAANQPVAFSYYVSAGDFVIALLLFFLIGLLVMQMLFTARRGKQA